MYYYNNELPPQQGWICPKCGRVNAPWMPTCGCVSSQTTASTTYDGVWEYVDGEWKKIKPQPDCDKKCVQTEIGCERTDCPWL